MRTRIYCRTPQGVRGLKLPTENTEGTMPMSHSARSAWIETGCPGCRRRYHLVALRKECAWIETEASVHHTSPPVVALLAECMKRTTRRWAGAACCPLARGWQQCCRHSTGEVVKGVFPQCLIIFLQSVATFQLLKEPNFQKIPGFLRLEGLSVNSSIYFSERGC